MILLVDNYDSFTYNLARYFAELGEEILIKRNDALTIKEITDINPDQIVISPGPCTPNEAGLSNRIITSFAGTIPILGVCLGHQCIGHVFGAHVRRAKSPIHGKTDTITHYNTDIFTQLVNPLTVMRYHSLIIDNIPQCLEITAYSESTQEIMGIRHKDYPIYGVQFHPESILSNGGYSLLANFIRLAEDCSTYTRNTKIQKFG